MPNAADLTNDPNLRREKILLVGSGGSGKTTQFLTLPGKKYMSIFDPAALEAIRGFDVDYDYWVEADYAIAARSLSKNLAPDKTTVKRPAAAELYQKWQQDFEEKMNSGFFAEYDWFCLDSLTTFGDSIMDRVLKINNRFGSQPQQDDWSAAINVMRQALKTFCALPCGILITGHLHMREEKGSNEMLNQIILPGQLRDSAPLLFGNVLLAEVAVKKDGTYQHLIRTRRNRDTRFIRTSLKNPDGSPVPTEIDVTIDFQKPVIGQGIAKLFGA